MKILRLGYALLNALLRHVGLMLMPIRKLYEWQQHPKRPGAYNDKCSLSAESERYLQPGNPRLLDLQDRYSAFNSDVTTPLVWGQGQVRPVDLLYFRGDNAFVWQIRGPNMNSIGYALATYYVKSIDRLGLLERLTEDEAFGNFTFRVGNKVVSRDLLDSILEMYFLDRHLELASFERLTVLDIGAGYGRLAHRMACALPNVEEYVCADAFPSSTFVCEYYMRYRCLEDRVTVIPLDTFENSMRHRVVDIAVNIHSFSECRMPAIEWWLSVLRNCNVRYLMIVPNAVGGDGQSLMTNDGKDFGEVINKYGYALRIREPKYRDPVVQKYGMMPAYHYLFERVP